MLWKWITEATVEVRGTFQRILMPMGVDGGFHKGGTRATEGSGLGLCASFSFMVHIDLHDQSLAGAQTPCRTGTAPPGLVPYCSSLEGRI